ncbi:MAG TPA: energy transducer TonB [Thermoanaerobaculia bacterium]
MKILPVAVLTSLALMAGARAWAQSPSTSPAPAGQAPASLSKRERIELCKKKMGVPLDLAESPPLRIDGTDGKVTRPTIVYQVPPRYAGSRGKVVVEAVIDEDGCVRQARVLQSAGRNLDTEAMQSIEQWVFLPAMRDGRPVRAYYVLTVNNH